MTRYNVRPATRRSGGGAWQWIVIGFVVGFGCAVMAALVAIIGGVDPTALTAAFRGTPTALVITATPPPFTATPEPTEVVQVVLPTATSAEAVVVLPTATQPPPTPLIQIEASPTQAVAPIGQADAAPTLSTGLVQSPNALNLPSLLVGRTSALVSVEGGTFNMGTSIQEVSSAVDECINTWEGSCQLSYGEDSAPEHSVTVNPFFIEDAEVTYGQYMSFLNSTNAGMGPNSHRRGCGGQLCILTRSEEPNSSVIFEGANYRVLPVIENNPATNVTWYGAQAYCESIGRRLPTEAEWERAARGPLNNLYPWGNLFDTNLARTSRPRSDQLGALPVRSYPANNLLYDMAGNVSEWVSDWYSPTYYAQLANTGAATLNPLGPPAGTQKVLRGGSWDAVPFFSRSVHRQSEDPVNGRPFIGFRCVADVGANTPGMPQSVAAPTSQTGTTTDAAAPTAATTGGTNEETTGNAAPTLPPPPATLPPSQPLPTVASGTLPP
ncbi:MAG TPA: SUMF1/EgtB/PvdO family nonheme iron enzyme [Aggregatilineales bacterium]|nr:SUMF1/EgtB/PvdO family nonheme iron enzyme [Aggregatilineales bacterium]